MARERVTLNKLERIAFGECDPLTIAQYRPLWSVLNQDDA
jgi:hypothetical protein